MCSIYGCKASRRVLTVSSLARDACNVLSQKHIYFLAREEYIEACNNGSESTTYLLPVRRGRELIRESTEWWRRVAGGTSQHLVSPASPASAPDAVVAFFVIRGLDGKLSESFAVDVDDGIKTVYELQKAM